MTNREYTLWQQWFTGLRPGYKVPISDAPLDRPRDLIKAGTTAPIDWTEHPSTAGLRDEPIRLPRDPVPWRKWDSMFGRPVQAAHPTDTMKVRWLHPEYGIDETVEIPAPNDGPLWVEDFPRPMWSMALDSARNAPDRHVIIVGENVTAELIGVSKVSGTPTVRGVGIWDNRTGDLLEGRPVIAAKRQLTPLLLGRDDIMHVLRHRTTITVKGSDADDRHFPWLNDWLALDPATLPDDLTRDAQVLADMWATFGVIVGDHGGVTSVSQISGANWHGIDFGDWTPRLSDFRRVTAAA